MWIWQHLCSAPSYGSKHGGYKMEVREENTADAGQGHKWESLSHWELDQRLDRAVEEMIEADLVAQVQEQMTSVLMQASQQEDSEPPDEAEKATPQQSESRTAVQESASQRSHDTEAMEANPTVQYVTNFLQSSSASKNRLSGRARRSLSHTVLLSLTLLSKCITYRSVCSRFHLEKGNLYRIFSTFCDQVIAQKDRLIQWPTGQEALQHLLPFSCWLSRNEALEESGLPRVLGVLGDTRIPIRLPTGKPDRESDTPVAKRPKNQPHPDSWLNLELVCNDEGRFIYCHISKGSQKDRGRALAERIRQNPEMVPPGTCLIAGVGYPLTEQILTPFPPGQNPQENLYNRSVGNHLDRIHQAVADLKERFQKLRYLDMGNYDKAKAVVLAACVLHNVYLDMGDVTKGLVERSTPEDMEEVNKDAAGVKMRETVVNLLYSTLEAAPQ
ncbi:putative nuclease HARBI1 isoform X2 [Cyprinus carpio]|uniref:Nuclease HARBI1 isoform X2 n=1 Tax=Cyprinus carpio TaxID=7962 RepID=A0A9Q9WCC7_CYPCA|nr:putative nuclease HARBI1 isoform X2 [Cyprinus carpio]